MANIPRPLIGLLVATVAFFAVWTIALKPSSSSRPATKPSTPAPAPAASSASKPQPTTSTASHASAAAKTAPAKTAPAKTASAKTAAKVAPKPAVTHAASTSQRVALVKNALADHKVLAVLFFNPAASDDQVVKHELGQLPVHGGKVVKLAVPLNELAQYPVITNQVQVTGSPTLVLIDPKRQADMLTGFVDQLVINRLVADAIASK
ncbi:MAG TPA: hypothetical protein VGF93_00890 [Solirubrobacteraceae bacterium]